MGSKPLAVAFSGGGDSTALLSLVLKWSKARPVHALIIDHGLRPGSAKEAKLAQSRAHNMGAKVHILQCDWAGNIPKTGIQEKARNMRYEVLGKACRELGVETLLLGHNEDDQAETILMRKNAGSGWRGLAGIKPKSRAPIWPALQGLDIVRPILSCGRLELRSFNKNRYLQWIDEPSNSDPTFARIRAREYLAKNENHRQNLLMIAKAASVTLEQEQKLISSFIHGSTIIYEWGGLSLLPKFRAGKSGQIAESLRYLLPAISGETLPPSYEKRATLARKLRSPVFTGTTLGGVRFVPHGDNILCVRDLGSISGRANVQALLPMPLEQAKSSIWNGRFAVSSGHDDIYVDALANWEQILDKWQQSLLKSLPEPMRGGLPVFIQDKRIAYIPFVGFPANKHNFKARSLLFERLAALLGDLYR